ncbi:hypothetical protein KUTeg_007607, partial [Tegillarca granosa]
MYFSVKRAKEKIVYGNQQNGPRMKKSDPDTPVLPDLKGEVHALDAKDIDEKENEDDTSKVSEVKEDSKAIEKELLDQVLTEGNEQTDNKNNEQQDQDDSLENKTTEKEEKAENNDGDNAKFSETAMAEITPEQENSIEELENASEGSKTGGNDVSEGGENTNDASETNSNSLKLPKDWFQNPFDLYKTYQNNYYANYPDDVLSYYNFLGRKRRMARRLPNSPIKRNRRIKRDLPNEIIYEPYLFSGSEYPLSTLSDDLDEPYVYSPEDNIEEYLELLEEASKADPRMMETEELVPTFDMAKRVVYNGEPGYFVPVKRQSYSFEDKRDQYFYPFSEEPKTHFSAFVPQKRDYADTYESLLRLARALGQADRNDV